ncbi:MAG TPA: thioredoxin domain-containing protein, partial [Anaerolineae bacterium]|nr:thioredoxin domain-containing protein [Anaerolineae bacterium]
MMSNRLAQETSPYLLQHADNPVDWYPWGEEALAKAKAEDKPILLSVGYAACHWCHVMAHESFEDAATAAIMNKYFVNIKVDREERPDIDRIYMDAVVAMTGQGGWPMTVAMTPDGEPFFGGTYYPRVPRYGMPSFSQVLLRLKDVWGQDRGNVVKQAKGISQHIQRHVALEGKGEVVTAASMGRAAQQALVDFDRVDGGFGSAPKFPPSMLLTFLLQEYQRTGDEEILHAVEFTLEKMAYGGMYDQVGGGFARYSVDGQWLVPHFEKMLYDNGLLSRLYVRAFMVTGRPLYRRIAEESLDWAIKEMREAEGGFYSSLDADSEGEEGKFYVWSAAEIDEILGEEGA